MDDWGAKKAPYWEAPLSLVWFGFFNQIKITPYKQETNENINNSEQPSVEIKILNVWHSEKVGFYIE